MVCDLGVYGVTKGLREHPSSPGLYLTCHHQTSGHFFFQIFIQNRGHLTESGPFLKKGLEKIGLCESNVMESWEGSGETKTKFGDMSKSSFLLSLETRFHQ